jgi:DNA-binding Lrp family transcriptional regulator
MSGMSAYILIQTEIGRASEVRRAVSALPGITHADDVTGPYEVIARAEVSSIEELGRQVIRAVQSIPGITRTITCPVVSLDS